jgi:hypothetical protein
LHFLLPRAKDIRLDDFHVQEGAEMTWKDKKEALRGNWTAREFSIGLPLLSSRKVVNRKQKRNYINIAEMILRSERERERENKEESDFTSFQINLECRLMI